MNFLEKYLVCPVSLERINENVVRIVGGFVALSTVVYLSTGWYWLMALLAVDFFIRGYSRQKISVLRGIALELNAILPLQPRPIDEAPKRFSARVGLIFCIVIIAASLLGFTGLAYGTGVVLLVCALLESLAGFCVGCHVYSILQKIT